MLSKTQTGISVREDRHADRLTLLEKTESKRAANDDFNHLASASDDYPWRWWSRESGECIVVYQAKEKICSGSEIKVKWKHVLTL